MEKTQTSVTIERKILPETTDFDLLARTKHSAIGEQGGTLHVRHQTITLSKHAGIYRISHQKIVISNRTSETKGDIKGYTYNTQDVNHLIVILC